VTDTTAPSNAAAPSAPVDPAAAGAAPRSIYLDAQGQTRTDLSLDDINFIIAQKSGSLWVELDINRPGQAEVLKGIKGLHPLAVEDALCVNSRPKLEEYDGYLFMIIIGVRFSETTEDPYDLETFDLCFFLGKNFLITVHEGQSASHRRGGPAYRKKSGSPQPRHGPPDPRDHGWRGRRLLSAARKDRRFRRPARAACRALKEIFAVKRLVLSLRRHVAPEREVFNIPTNRPSELLSPESQVYFRDIYDHVLRIDDSIDTYRDLLSSVLDSYLTQVSNRLGRVTKGLSVVATLSIPFVVISGMWGMNVEHIPLSRHPQAFWWMLALQLGLGIMLLVILRFRKLL
jgi:magnesium transporter